jgi:hypothetical protein
LAFPKNYIVKISLIHDVMPLKAEIGLFETFLLGEKKDKKEETLSTRLRVLAYFTL